MSRKRGVQCPAVSGFQYKQADAVSVAGCRRGASGYHNEVSPQCHQITTALRPLSTKPTVLFSQVGCHIVQRRKSSEAPEVRRLPAFRRRQYA